MSEVFKVRFDGREWWAMRIGEPDDAVYLTDPARLSSYPPDPTSVAYCSSYEVPEHMVERIEELPPEPPVGTVLWDKDDVGCVRDHDLWNRFSFSETSGLDESMSWRILNRDHGPLHPYPRAARDEIERPTARADELQKRIDDALRYLDRPSGLVTSARAARILRGES